MIDNQEIKFMAEKIGDFKLAYAAFEIDDAWKYLESFETKNADLSKQPVSKNKTVAKAIKANHKRYNVVTKQIASEISEDYEDIYTRERDALIDYCYAALGDLLEETYPAEWSEMLIEHEAELAEKKKKRAAYEENHALDIAIRRGEADKKRLAKAKERYEKARAAVAESAPKAEAARVEKARKEAEEQAAKEAEKTNE